LTAEVVHLVREAKADDRVLLSSFNPICLWKARMLAPHLPRALLFESQSAWPLRTGLSAPALEVVAMHPEKILATPERVAGWRKRGYLVACWTVDDLEEAQRLFRSGASGIITNRPGPMRERFQ